MNYSTIYTYLALGNHNSSQSTINLKFRGKPIYIGKPLELGDLEINFEGTSWGNEIKE